MRYIFNSGDPFSIALQNLLHECYVQNQQRGSEIFDRAIRRVETELSKLNTDLGQEAKTVRIE